MRVDRGILHNIPNLGVIINRLSYLQKIKNNTPKTSSIKKQ
jgi:hypothetical protein